MPSGPARYQSYPSHLQRTSVPPEAYTPSMDSNAAKEQSREGGKNRGGLPKHMQEQHMSKSESKLSSPVPGGLYPGTYPPPSSRSQHLLPPQSETPPSRGESGTPSREKTQNKPMTIQEHELRVLGKITPLWDMEFDKGLSPFTLCLNISNAFHQNAEKGQLFCSSQFSQT